MKDMTIRKRLAISFGMIDVLFILALLSGYYAVSHLTTAEDPKLIANGYKITCVVLFVVTGLVMTTITNYILKTIRLSMDQLSEVATKIAEGDVNVNLEKHANDEFGKVIDEYKIVVDNIKEEADVVSEIAEGNLTVTVTPKSDKDLLGKSLLKLVGNTHHAMHNIHDAAYQVMSSSSEVASASEALAQGSTEQASAIEQITASIDEVADKTKNNAVEAAAAAELMNEALVDVNQGNQQMHDMVKAMEDINMSSESISKIIKVIDDIAFQTNILALNAAVEAARAGDAGMGFAVVAEEVRNLAAKSAEAAAETAEMIEDSIRKVQNGSEIAGTTAKSLEVISDVVAKSENIVKGIAEASNYQATAIEQIDQAVEQVSQVVQSNSSTSEECAAASRELSEQADRMRELVSIYKLDTTSNFGAPSFADMSPINSVNPNESIISLGDGFGKY